MRNFFFAACFVSTVACGGSLYMPSRAANFDPDGTAQIDDADVRKAF